MPRVLPIKEILQYFISSVVKKQFSQFFHTHLLVVTKRLLQKILISENLSQQTKTSDETLQNIFSHFYSKFCKFYLYF